jgi:hypothetical protein
MVRREKLPEHDESEARNTFAEDSDRIRRLFYPESLKLPVTDVDETSNSMKVSTTDPVLIDFSLLLTYAVFTKLNKPIRVRELTENLPQLWVLRKLQKTSNVEHNKDGDWERVQRKTGCTGGCFSGS